MSPNRRYRGMIGVLSRRIRPQRLPALLTGAGCVLVLACWAPTANAAAVDPASGLIQEPGWELVRAQCGGCHSYGLITNQRGDRQTWMEIIRRMQQTENLWQLGVDLEAAILDYLAGSYPPALADSYPPALADSYPPAANFRRAPLPKHLMPEPAAATSSQPDAAGSAAGSNP